MGNEAAGAKIFRTKCAQCHVAEKGGGHKQVRTQRPYANLRLRRVCTATLAHYEQTVRERAANPNRRSKLHILHEYPIPAPCHNLEVVGAWHGPRRFSAATRTKVLCAAYAWRGERVTPLVHSECKQPHPAPPGIEVCAVVSGTDRRPAPPQPPLSAGRQPGRAVRARVRHRGGVLVQRGEQEQGRAVGRGHAVWRGRGRTPQTATAPDTTVPYSYCTLRSLVKGLYSCTKSLISPLFMTLHSVSFYPHSGSDSSSTFIST